MIALLLVPVGEAGAQSGGRIFLYEGCNGCPRPEGYRVMSGDGRIVRDLPDVPVSDFVPSGDGSRVLYFRRGLVAADATFERPVLLAPSVEIGFDELDPRDPDWSPSGDLVAYYGPGPNTTRNEDEGLVVVPSAGGERTMLPNSWLLTDPSWAPDERRLVAARPATNVDPISRLVIVDRVSGAQTVVLSDQPGVQLLDPQWSPDGSQIIYARATDSGPFARLWRVAPDGTGARELVSRDVPRGGAHWSPDGRAIVFMGLEQDPSTAGLYTIRADGSGLRLVRGSRGMQVRPLGWVTGDLAPLAPRLGKTVVAEVESGSVRVRRRGSRGFVDVVGDATIPVGSLVDTRKGAVRITSAAGRTGGKQSGVFHGGVFKVLQKRAAKPVTELRLAGKLERCGRSGRAGAARTRGRRLWGDVKGRFRTRGRRSAATATGTKWLVADRCDLTTLTRVRSGRVSVLDFARGRTVTLRAGQGYVAG